MVPVNSPIGKNNEKHSIASEMEEPFIRLHNPFVNMLMRSTAERRISAHFTIAKFIISAFADIEGNWSVSGYYEFALSIAERIIPAVAAGTPIVFFSSE